VPLRVRLALLFAAGTVVVLALAGGTFYLQLRSSLRTALDANLRGRADALLTHVTTPSDTDGVSPLTADVLSRGGGTAQVIAPSGTVVTSSADARGTAMITGPLLAAARTAPQTYTWREPGREKLRVQATAIPSADGRARPTNVLVVAAPSTVMDTAEDRVRDIMLIATAPTIVLSGLAAWVLSGAALRPVERMRRQVAAMEVADSGAQLAVPSTRDEIAALASTMNDLLGRLHDARARDRAFVADAGHELRTPLTTLKAEFELALRPGRSAGDLTEAITAAAVETDRLIRLSEALLALASLDAPGRSASAEIQDGRTRHYGSGYDRTAHDRTAHDRTAHDRTADAGTQLTGPSRRQTAQPWPRHARPMPLAELLDGAARAAAAPADAAGVRIIPTVEDDVPVPADPDRLRQAVDNLLANAIRHAPAGGVIEVLGRREIISSGAVLPAPMTDTAAPGSAARPTRETAATGPARATAPAGVRVGHVVDGPAVVVEVRDRGPGFPPEFLPRAFDRFSRADEARARQDGGAGLGLAIVAAIAQAHGGHVTAANRPDGGATVRIILSDTTITDPAPDPEP
jgi:hypothetical protein